MAGNETNMTPATPTEFARAVAAFNDQAFFECHEILEPVWLAAAPDQRPFYQGIIQAAAAFVHWQRGETTGIVTLLTAALARLAPYAPETAGLDLARFRRQLATALAYFSMPEATVAGFTKAALPRLDLREQATADPLTAPAGAWDR